MSYRLEAISFELLAISYGLLASWEHGAENMWKLAVDSVIRMRIVCKLKATDSICRIISIDLLRMSWLNAFHSFHARRFLALGNAARHRWPKRYRRI